jgi:type II secretory pathway predicted ATPase ExeA
LYLEHFHLSRLPFQNTPDPAFFFASHSHRQALASMLFGIENAQGFVLVIGDVGTGKTLLVQALKKELGDRHVLVEISNPWATPKACWQQSAAVSICPPKIAALLSIR